MKFSTSCAELLGQLGVVSRVASTRSRFSVPLAKLEACVSLRWGTDTAAGPVEEFGTVASALTAAHEAGIVHRDIKPENLMLRPDGYLKVLDFGLAKLTESQAAASDDKALTVADSETEAGVVMGTVGYMSPEQVRGQKVDARTDIFSLGVVLYEMLAGRAPFAGASNADVIAAVLQTEPLPLARHSREVPEALAWIVTKALRKDRAERYQTIRDLSMGSSDT